MTGVRHHFAEELEQLRLQVELMGVRVDENLERMRIVLRTGDPDLAERMIAGDDGIDAMNVSLTERCYDLLRREAPVATDLRFVVSVLRVLSDIERIGDLSLRVAKQAPDHDALRASAVTFDILLAICDEAIERFRTALRAWAEMDLTLAISVTGTNRAMDALQERLMLELLRVDGNDAARIAVATFAVGRALERIGDHAAVIGTRVRYLITGDPAHLAAEVR